MTWALGPDKEPTIVWNVLLSGLRLHGLAPLGVACLMRLSAVLSDGLQAAVVDTLPLWLETGTVRCRAGRVQPRWCSNSRGQLSSRPTAWPEKLPGSFLSAAGRR